MVTIVCDTRQKLKHHEKKEQYFAEVGIKTLRSKLPCGDYARLDNMSVCIETGPSGMCREYLRQGACTVQRRMPTGPG